MAKNGKSTEKKKEEVKSPKIEVIQKSKLYRALTAIKNNGVLYGVGDIVKELSDEQAQKLLASNAIEAS